MGLSLSRKSIVPSNSQSLCQYCETSENVGAAYNTTCIAKTYNT